MKPVQGTLPEAHDTCHAQSHVTSLTAKSCAIRVFEPADYLLPRRHASPGISVNVPLTGRRATPRSPVGADRSPPYVR